MKVNPRLERAQRIVGRRMFLGAIGAGLSVAMAGRVARLAVASPTAPSKRFFVFFMPHGMAPEHFDPRVIGGDRTNFALDQTNVSILGPLQPYKSYVNVYQGFQYRGKARHTRRHRELSVRVRGCGHHDTAHQRRARDRARARGRAADSRGVLAPTVRPRRERHALLGRRTRRSREEPSQSRRRPVRRRRGSHAAARSRRGVPARAFGADRSGNRGALERALGSFERADEACRASRRGAGAEERRRRHGGVHVHRRARRCRPSRWSARRAPDRSSTRAAATTTSTRSETSRFSSTRSSRWSRRRSSATPRKSSPCSRCTRRAISTSASPARPGAHHNGLSHTGPQWPPRARSTTLPSRSTTTCPKPRAPFAGAQKWFIQKLRGQGRRAASRWPTTRRRRAPRCSTTRSST